MIVDHICVNYGARLFQELFSELDKRGIEQNVFYPRNRTHRVVARDLPYRLDSPLVLNLSTKLSFRKKRHIMQKQYDPLFHRNKPNLIHAHTLFSDGSLAYRIHKKYGTPYVMAVRSSDMDVFLKYKPWLYMQARQIVAHASHIIFISPAIKKKFLKKFGSDHESKSLVIPNGINQVFFQQEVKDREGTQTPSELLYVGSFLKRKEVPSLINLAIDTGSRLSIAGGGGGQEKRVRQLIQESDQINFLGRVQDPSRLVEIYRQSDIFIMASRRETFGLVYLEAMSQGLPLIYSRGTGIDGLFTEGTVGYGVKPGSVPEMRDKLKSILGNYQEISQRCISEAKKFNWKSIAESYLKTYNEITA